MFNVPDTTYLSLQEKHSAAAGLDVKSETCMKWGDEHHLKTLADFQLHEWKSIFPLLLEYFIHFALFFLVSIMLNRRADFSPDHRSEKSICFSSFDYFQQPSSWKFTESCEFWQSISWTVFMACHNLILDLKHQKHFQTGKNKLKTTRVCSSTQSMCLRKVSHKSNIYWCSANMGTGNCLKRQKCRCLFLSGIQWKSLC